MCYTERGEKMNASATIEGSGHVPGEPILVIPNRVNIEVLRVLEDELSGARGITWLVEDSLRPGGDIISHMQRKSARGALFHADPAGRERLHARISAELAAGRHVVLLPGRPLQPAGALADVPMETLHYLLDGYSKNVLPVYAGMYNVKKPPLVVTQAPYEKLLLRLLPVTPGGQGLADGVWAAWLEAGAEQVSRLTSENTECLSQALLRSLLAHAQATIIDGVDDSRMSYRHLLYLATPLARYLCKHIASKRMGIILPPGKLSIIANVACILAGITPVNIDYSYSKPALKRVIAQAGITRFITEHCFIDMQQRFDWPPHRDMLFIDEALAPSGFRMLSKWNLLSRWVTHARISKWIRTPASTPQDEALAVFSPAEEGSSVRGVSFSHRAVLSGAALCYSRFGVGEGQRVLSALPFHYSAGLLSGLIHPLLMGQDIITYPIPGASKRLCHLARQYGPAFAVFTPQQAQDVLEHAKEEDFAATSCFHVAGRVPAALARHAYEKCRIFLCECYLPLESAMSVSCNMPPPAAAGQDAPARALSCGAPGSAGMLLPGVAVRITDMDHPDTPQPLSLPGLVWVKSVGLASADLNRDKPDLHAHERWRCTGEIGCLRADGLLSIGGPRARFSKVKGEILSHEEIERLMVKFLRVEEKPGKPRIAIVGLPDAEGGDAQIVLLSTVHKVVGPHDAITLRYDLTNAHYPSHWAPSRIVALRAIPTLPGGQVDYTLCHALALKVLGANPS